MFLSLLNYASRGAKAYEEGVRQTALTEDLRRALRNREIEKTAEIFAQLSQDVLPKVCFSAFHTAAMESDLGLVEILANHTACKPFLQAICLGAVSKFPRNSGFFSLITPHLSDQEKKKVALTALSQKELPLFRKVVAEISWKERRKSKRLLEGFVEHGLFREFSAQVSFCNDLQTVFQIAFSHCHVHILTELVKKEFLKASCQEANECLDAMRAKEWTKACSAIGSPKIDVPDLQLLLVHAAVYDREDLLKTLSENKMLSEVDHAKAFALRVEANPLDFLDFRDESFSEEEPAKPNPLLQFCSPKWKRGTAAFRALFKEDLAEAESLLGEGEVYTFAQKYMLPIAVRRGARGAFKLLADFNALDQEATSIAVIQLFEVGDYESGELLLKSGCVLKGEPLSQARELAYHANKKSVLRLLGENLGTEEEEGWTML